jgi:hypothetical protein
MMEREIKIQLMIEITDFERDLRSFVKQIVLKHFGKSWFDKPEPVNEALRRLKEDVKKNFNSSSEKMKKYNEPYKDDFFDYLSFHQYSIIIIELWESKNGTQIFHPFFPSKEFVIDHLDYLNQHRNAIKGHDREVLNKAMIEKIQFYLKDFAQHIPGSTYNKLTVDKTENHEPIIDKDIEKKIDLEEFLKCLYQVTDIGNFVHLDFDPDEDPDDIDLILEKCCGEEWHPGRTEESGIQFAIYIQGIKTDELGSILSKIYQKVHFIRVSAEVVIDPKILETIVSYIHTFGYGYDNDVQIYTEKELTDAEIEEARLKIEAYVKTWDEGSKVALYYDEDETLCLDIPKWDNDFYAFWEIIDTINEALPVKHYEIGISSS